MSEPTPAAAPTPRRRVPRWVRIPLAIVVGLLGFIALVAAVVLLVEPLRNRILDEALTRANDALPGELAVAEARWPTPDRVRLRDLLWTDGGDTLLAADRVETSIRLGALLRRSVSVRALEVDGLVADVPALQVRFPAGETKAAGDPGRTAFPKEGSFPDAPSIGVDRIAVQGSRVRVSETLTLRDLLVVASADLLAGGEPGVRVDTLRVRSDDEPAWSVGDAGFRLDPVRARLAADLRAVVAGHALRLRVEAPADARFAMVLEGDDAWDVRLDGSIQRRELRPVGIDIAGELNPPAMEVLRAVPALEEALRDLPDLALPRATFTLAAAVEPDTTARVALRLEPTDWLRSGRLLARAEGRDVAVDSLALELEGLRLNGTASLTGERVDAAIRARVTGTGWLTRFRPELVPPDALALDLRVGARGPVAAPAVDAALTGSVTLNGRVIDGIDVRASVPGDGDVLVDAAAVVEDLTVRVDAAITRGAPIVIRLAPIAVTEGRTRASGSRAPREGRVRFDPETGAVDARAVRVTGALGQLAASGTWTREETGTFAVDAIWPRPPAPLRRVLADRGAPVDSLRDRWVADGPFRVRLSGTAARRGEAFRVTADGAVELPGPRTLHPFLPPGSRVEDLGTLRATVSMDAITTQTVPEGRFDLDLTETDWIEAGRIRVRSREGRADVDTLGLRLEGVTAEVRGWVDETALALEGGVDLADTRFLERLLGERAAGLDAAASVQVSVSGSPKDPRGEATFTGRVTHGELVVEGVRGNAVRDDDGVRAELEATAPLRSGSVVLDRARITASAPPSLDRAALTIDLSGDEVAIYQVGRISNGDRLVVDVDTLRIRLQDETLAALAPFRAEMDPAAKRFALDGLRMGGSLGTLDASGFASPDATDLRARVLMDLPDRPAFITAPDGLWPRRIEAAVRALGREELEASALVTGLSLPGNEDLTVRFAGEGRDRWFSAQVEVEGDGRTRLFGRARVPGRVSLFPFATELEDGPLRGELILDGAPVPFSIDPEADETPVGRADGKLVLGGTTGDPQAAGSMTLGFPDWPKLAKHVAELTFRFRGEAALDSALAALLTPVGGGTGAAVGADEGAGFRTRFGVRRGDRVLLDGRVDLPVALSLLTGKATIPEGAPIDARVEAREFPLVDLNPFLPANAGVDGTCTLRLDARGPARDPALEGQLRFRKTTLSLADGSRAAAKGDLTFGGTGQRPGVRGKIEVESGVIRVPEQQRLLLPASGSSRLWDLEAFRPEAADSVVARPAPAAPPMDLNVTVTIPSGLWIQGRGLEVELAGDLQLVQQGTTPTVNGELKAVRGQLTFLGRRFTVDRGVVTFYGGDTIDPTLDLELSARVGSETIRILFRGTAQEPDLTLESDSGLNEGDILAVILFGAPLDQLDASQTGSLAGEVARSIAASQLEASVARQLGVDMITVRQGRSEQESLIIGKYITRRALLKYEQALSSTSTFFLNLEYFLTRTLKLETLYGSDSQSAIEVNWSRDY